MENQPVFVRILEPERENRLLSEISLRSMRILLECKNFCYDVVDDLCGYPDDDWEIMLAHFKVVV